MRRDPAVRLHGALHAGLLFLVGALATLVACGDGSRDGTPAPSPGGTPPPEKPGKVVLYTSLNEPTARAVLSKFEESSGVAVELHTDTERDKTVGLVQLLLEEKGRPRADVFWNSEAAHTVRLKHAGVLEKLEPPPAGADRIPAQYRDAEGVWFGFAARARVLIVNTDLVPADRRPKSMWDVVDPQWKGRTGFVRPVTGTTLTQVTALYHALGPERTDEFLRRLGENQVNLPPGNGRLASLVGAGEIAFGFTDTSDYRLVKAEGKPVDVVYPDQDGLGALLIPNTVARVRGGPNPAAARKLIEFLLSDEAERILAFHPRGHIPLKPGIEHPPEVKVPGEFRTMTADFERIGLEVERRLGEMNERFR